MNNVTYPVGDAFPDNPTMENLEARIGRSDKPSWWELETKEREAANHAAALKNNGLGGNIVGMAGEANQCGPEPCCDPKPLRILERVSYRRRAAMKANEEFYKLDELHGLLQKNPEVARILELIDEVGR